MKHTEILREVCLSNARAISLSWRNILEAFFGYKTISTTSSGGILLCSLTLVAVSAISSIVRNFINVKL